MDRATPRDRSRAFHHTMLMIAITRKIGGANATVVMVREEGYGVGGERKMSGKRSSASVWGLDA